MSPWLSLINLFIGISKGFSVILLGYLWGRKTRIPGVLRPLLWYVVFDAAIYVLGVAGSRLYHNNVPGFHLSTFSDVTCLTLLFVRLASPRVRPWLRVGWVGFVGSALVSALWVDGLCTNINTLSRGVGNLFLVGMALRQLMQMSSYKRTLPPMRNPEMLLCVMVLLYYSCSTLVIIGQDLPRYSWFKSSYTSAPGASFTILTLLPYPFLRAIQAGVLVRLFALLPQGVRPRRALPRWLRFRLGWRPPTEPPQYRVLPAYLIK
ncbi:hypothetical protein K3G63_16285 [Hymenobacter sp. HSC-4F20]|uniref:hypothetical protein n=1 Tax=Hymenobacter sp. HSC-4F20 TaxID=2864135 RepID=UPI001C7327D7|nr:hypothetical protein [Hymenobacter sp. HSC-4F20]MBX0292011.1 hypothetical protein [Hymenobacter sp. HSC-4F20]